MVYNGQRCRKKEEEMIKRFCAKGPKCKFGLIKNYVRK